MKKLLIIGAGGHGRVAADVADSMRCYEEIAYLDDATPPKTLRYQIIGNSLDATKYIKTHDFFVAIGDAAIRESLITHLTTKGARVVSLVHASACISPSATIDLGTIIMPLAVVNANATIGRGVIINTNASVDHDCVVGNYCHIAVGARLCGTVDVGHHVMIGAGATIINNLSVESHCTVGAGSVVVKTLSCIGTYIGVPARKVSE